MVARGTWSRPCADAQTVYSWTATRIYRPGDYGAGHDLRSRRTIGRAPVDGLLLGPEGPSDPQGHAGARPRQASVGLPAAVRATHPRERHRRGDRGADRAYVDPGTAWL